MDFNDILQQASKVQAQLGKDMDELSKKEFEINTNGAITLKIKGDFTVTSIDIASDVLEDKEMLEQMLVTCFNQAIKKIQKEQEKIQQQSISMAGLF